MGRKCSIFGNESDFYTLPHSQASISPCSYDHLYSGTQPELWGRFLYLHEAHPKALFLDAVFSVRMTPHWKLWAGSGRLVHVFHPGSFWLQFVCQCSQSDTFQMVNQKFGSNDPLRPFLRRLQWTADDQLKGQMNPSGPGTGLSWFFPSFQGQDFFSSSVWKIFTETLHMMLKYSCQTLLWLMFFTSSLITLITCKCLEVQPELGLCQVVCCVSTHSSVLSDSGPQTGLKMGEKV